MGFDPGFLSFPAPLPSVKPEIRDDLALLGGSPIIDYTHFSLALSTSRRIARWVAWNIDGLSLDDRLGRQGLDFREDPRLPGLQLLDDVYSANRLDRGHVARRADLLWGSADEAAQANSDSFFFTNITPQMDNFNQSKEGGVWGRLENAILSKRGLGARRASVVGGPVLSDDDELYRGSVLVPREFWKLILYNLDGRPRARAFIVSQSLVGLEEPDLDLREFETFEVTVPELETKIGVIFGAEAQEFDVLAALPATAIEERQPVRSLNEVTW